MVGSGGTDIVYREEMIGGKVIAVTKLWGVDKEEINWKRAVLAEVEILNLYCEEYLAESCMSL